MPSNETTRTFWVAVAALFAFALTGLALRGVHLPALLIFVPSIFLTTVLCDLATVVLLAVIFAKTRRNAWLPLGVLFLASTLLECAVFATIRLPQLPAALVFPGNPAAPWLWGAEHLIVAACATWYALARRTNSLLSAVQVRRSFYVWLPAAIVTVLAAIALFVVASESFPALTNGDSFVIERRFIVLAVSFVPNALALVLCLRLLRPPERNDVDTAVTLILVTGCLGIAVSAFQEERYTTFWVATRLLYVISSTFVLIASIRLLIDRLGENLRIESELIRAQALAFEQNAAVEASLVKSRFVATVSHELRTPLGGIIGMTELLERTPLTERQVQFTGAIRSSAHSLLRIVNDLLDFSRAESGRLEIEDLPFDVGRAVEEIVLLFREQARRKNVTLHSYVDPAMPRTLIGDEMRVKQVLQNLVGNALRFTLEGGVRVEVTPEIHAGKNTVRFSVSDSGIGISQRALERIFEPFVQEDATTARRFGGTGLGLSISRHLVEMMGGRIAVRSTVGEGSTFSFRLPYRDAGNGSDRRPSLRDVTALIWEPEAAARALLGRYIDGWEMPGVLVASRAEARASLAAGLPAGRRFDLLLVGPGVAAREAIEFAAETRDDLARTPCGAIAIRDDAPGGNAQSGLAGFDETIVGTLRQSELLAAIVRLSRDGIAKGVLPAIAGIATRAPRSERILVAEDNEINQALLSAQLEHLGFTADVVSDGAAAVDAAVSGRYALVFMDCQMPGVDGFEAARLIRAAASAHPVTIVAVTANVLPGYRETCIAAGMNDYLPKPALIGPLTAILDRWLPPTGPRSIEPGSASSAHALERLREIFHGDEARVRETIRKSRRALEDAAETLRAALGERDADAAARTAHRMTGVALEIGLDGPAAAAREIQTAVEAGAWKTAAGHYRQLVAALADGSPWREVRS